MRTLRDILDQLPTTPDVGLAPEAVPVSAERFGHNRLTPLPREPIWRKFLDKFDEPIIKILLTAALLSMVVDLFGAGRTAESYTPSIVSGVVVGLVIAAVLVAYLLKRAQWLPTILFLSAIALGVIGVSIGHPAWDGLAVMVAVSLATGVAFLSEYQSDREFEILNARKDQIIVKVVRGGEFQTIALEDVAVGDVVDLETGDEIPADGRLAKATELLVDQSLMTGESEPVAKRPESSDETADGPDQPGCLYRGTQVVDGLGRMVVAEVGDATLLGQIARRLCGDGENREPTVSAEANRIRHKLTISKHATPLQEKLERLAGLISRIGYIAATAIFLALLVRGFLSGEIGWTEPGPLKTFSHLLDYFLYMVIIIVVAVPEGLPMSVTVSLALAMRKMTRANSLVRQLVACETIGSATVICTDKTGTLTENKMRVARVGVAGCTYEGSIDQLAEGANSLASCANFEDHIPPSLEELKPLDWVILNAAVNSTANVEKQGAKKVPFGNSTEGALLLWLSDGAWLKKHGIDYRDLRLRFPSMYQIHFSSERKRMTTVIRVHDRLAALVKGAAEWLLERSSHYQAGAGRILPWTPEARAEVHAQLTDASSHAMRTLAFGFKLLPSDHPSDDETLHARRESFEHGLVYAGLVAIRDPLRADVRGALDQCREAGLEVKMITGDNVETARAVSEEVGLLDKPQSVLLTSPEFNAFTDEQLKERLPNLRVLARARPLDKLRMVRLLQEQGEVVAVTGDGANDAPALKKADVGLAMGVTGAEVAKEASKIVLLDDSFMTIVNAVHWGRALYENIQRFVQFQLTINVSALVIAFLAPLFGIRPPFTILQLLWINVIMDTFASIALCSEPPRPGLMRQPPKRRDESILTRAMLWNIGTTAAFFVLVMLLLLLGMARFQWFAGAGPNSEEFPELTTRQVSIFFTVFVLFQVWNEINCRSLVPEVSGFSGLLRNPVFLTIAALIVLGQILIVTFGGETVFKVEPLRLLDWLAIALGTSSVLLFAEVSRRVRLALRTA
jgi:P-type Ca2+ transporter type 2C